MVNNERLPGKLSNPVIGEPDGGHVERCNYSGDVKIYYFMYPSKTTPGLRQVIQSTMFSSRMRSHKRSNVGIRTIEKEKWTEGMDGCSVSPLLFFSLFPSLPFSLFGLLGINDDGMNKVLDAHSITTIDQFQTKINPTSS